MMSSGHIVRTSIVSPADAKFPVDIMPAVSGQTILAHESLNFISYSYEWSFTMLKEAALLTLNIQEQAIKHGYSLKDATSFNIAFRDRGPVFLDVLSFEIYNEGKPWIAHGQFCRCFLFPLFITAYLGLPFHAILRGNMGEISLNDVRLLFGWRNIFKKGVFSQILLPAKLEKDFASMIQTKNGTCGTIENISKKNLLVGLQNLREIISSLRPLKNHSVWTDYAQNNSYDEKARRLKRDFVTEFSRSLGANKVLVDLGANNGEYSHIAAAFCKYVIALDYDSTCIDFVYVNRSDTNIIPIVCDLSNPSPSQGWRQRERASLFERIQSEGFLALALIHHLRVSANIPLTYIVDWLATLGECGVVEWVGKTDCMVQKLLAIRADVYFDYNESNFRELLLKHFMIVKESPTYQEDRRLFSLKKIK